MKIAIATPILFDNTSPFNHLFKDIIGGFIEAGYEIIRFVAVRNDLEDDYKFGYANVEYVKYKRSESRHNNIISRYLRDTLTNIKEARGIKNSKANVLFEDVSYSSFWTVNAAKKRGMRIVAMLQDVWPDNAVQSGLLRQDGILYKYFEAWQRYIYKNADRIICISDDMKDFIVSKGVEENKIEVIYNWGFRDEIVSIPWEENEFVKKYCLDRNRFYAVYAGNIGKMQNVELIVRAADKLKGEPNIHFLIVGDGARKSEIEKMAKGKDNITMLPLQPTEFAEHIYSMAGVNIIPLVEGGPKTAMPSKTGVVLSCCKPVVFCFGSGTRFAEKLLRIGAGCSVSATDEKELAKTILDISKGIKRLDNAKDMFIDSFTRSSNIWRYVETIKR